MKFNAKDYQKIKYPIHKLKSGESVFKLGDISPLEHIFSKQSDDEKVFDLEPEFVMKYIILMYSPGSPAIEKFQSMGKRKTWILSQLGVEPDEKGKYEDSINYLTLYKVPSVVRKTSLFLSLQAPNDWQIKLHGQEQLSRLLTFVEAMETPTSTTIALTLEDELKQRKLIEETRKQVENATKRIMDNEPSLIQELDIDHFAAQTFLGIRPEEQLKFLPEMKKPKDQKADAFFPQVGN